MLLLQGYELTGDAACWTPRRPRWTTCWAATPPTCPGSRARPNRARITAPRVAAGKAVPGFLVGGPNPNMQDKAQCRPYPSTEVANTHLDHICSFASNGVAISWNAPLVYVSRCAQKP